MIASRSDRYLPLTPVITSCSTVSGFGEGDRADRYASANERRMSNDAERDALPESESRPQACASSRDAVIKQRIVAGEVTELLRRYQSGDEHAPNEILGRVYSELHRMAHQQAHSTNAANMRPTELISEFYLAKLRPASAVASSRTHFLNIATRAIRGLAVDGVRRSRAKKRGGGKILQLTEAGEPACPNPLVSGDHRIWAALNDLREIDPRAHEVFLLRAGRELTNAQTADTLGMSVAKVRRDMAWAKTWLTDRLARVQGAD